MLRPAQPAEIVAGAGGAKVMLLGGAPMDGPRHIWWNFVSSRKERIEQAKADWKENRFAKVPGDPEFIPLPVNRLGRTDIAAAARIVETADRLRHHLLGQPQDGARHKIVNTMVARKTT